jgi:hypothetical protein
MAADWHRDRPRTLSAFWLNTAAAMNATIAVISTARHSTARGQLAQEDILRFVIAFGLQTREAIRAGPQRCPIGPMVAIAVPFQSIETVIVNAAVSSIPDSALLHRGYHPDNS